LPAEVELDVVVQPLRREVPDAAVPLVAEHARAPGKREQLAQRIGELLVDDRRADLRAVLPAELQPDAAAAQLQVTLRDRRDAVRPGLTHVALRSDPKPAEVDQPQRDGADALAVEP